MNVRQQLYKKYRIQKGMSKYAAARKAGYSHNTAICAKQNIENRLNMDHLLEMEGLTDEALAEHARQGMNAVKVHGTSDDFIEIPDWANRFKYFERVMKIRGHIKDEPLVDNSQHRHITVILDGQSDIQAKQASDRVLQK